MGDILIFSSSDPDEPIGRIRYAKCGLCGRMEATDEYGTFLQACPDPRWAIVERKPVQSDIPKLVYPERREA